MELDWDVVVIGRSFGGCGWPDGQRPLTADSNARYVSRATPS